ncbi:MAG TPA: polyribonucleotide nucleotidyltransferase [Candidatus Methylacidiphilales bacterium]|jgi:polyribonucleotide nucleotidyltransferase|nr:polyribonucleotide nucleotidyltransferase [Candidatus Methylacidiphilales bacterium]
MSTIHTVSAPFGAHPIIIETGKLANLADGAVTVRYADTLVIVTAVSATKIKEGQDFFPLTVEYRERAAAVGKIPGGYFKREGRPSEKEILTCRMTDRPLRPLFPKGYLYDTQIITTLLSADGENDPDILSINGASAALMVSDIPFGGPIGALRVGRVDGKFVTNPTHAQMELSDLDLVYVATETEILMIEGSALELPETDFKAALAYAQEEAQIVIHLQKDLAAKVNKAKRTLPLYQVKPELVQLAYDMVSTRIEDAIYRPSKVERYAAVGALKDEVAVAIKAKYPEATGFDISSAFDQVQIKAFRTAILDKQQRSDGRAATEIRPLSGEVGLLPRSHGSSLFARGETQALCLATLAPSDEAQDLDGYTGGEISKRFILHYNFPPFSVGETGRVGGLNRREIGHGALAERSLLAIIPTENDFPYAIRVSSEIMSSNGSTSMASVCGGCLALMDAGVPIKTPVAGISVGLVTEHDEHDNLKRYLLLADILGSEDHYGDMDFKLSGTREGVTGFQLDLKLGGIPLQIMNEAIDQAKITRGQILDFMQTVINAPRTEMSQYAPRIETIQINPEKIGLVIGPGGKNIKSIVAETGAEINIEDDGRVKIYSTNGDAMERAKEIILGMVGDIEIGKIYRGRVVTLKDFGAFVEVLPGKDGLVHISEWSDARVNRMDDVAKIGDEVWVKCIGQDDKGRSKLSRKAAMKERAAEGLEAPAKN